MFSPKAGPYLYLCICLGSMENDTVSPIGPSAWTLTQLTILTDDIKPSVSVCVCVGWITTLIGQCVHFQRSESCKRQHLWYTFHNSSALRHYSHLTFCEEQAIRHYSFNTTCSFTMKMEKDVQKWCFGRRGKRQTTVYLIRLSSILPPTTFHNLQNSLPWSDPCFNHLFSSASPVVSPLIIKTALFLLIQWSWLVLIIIIDTYTKLFIFVSFF